MEVEDPLSAKFRALIEGLMVSTTSEIVKIFSKVLLETRVEITRSWREIDLLKKHLEECEQQKTEAIFRAQRSDFKREDDEMEVSCGNSQLGVQSANTVRPGDVGPEGRAENVSVGNRGVSLGNAKASGPETARSSKPASSGHNVQKSCTQVVVKPKIVCPTKLSQGKGQKASSSKTTSQPMSEKMKKRKLIKKQNHTNDISVARGLRDRQHLSMQRQCLCCSSDECDNPSRAQQQVPSVYICRKCERRFKTDLLFKSHKCSMPQNCNRCGQMFTTLQGLTAHSQEVQPQFSCSQCEQMFATQCAWTVHKRIHTNLIVPNEIKAKRFEVRLERISDSQLEAALSSNSFPLRNNSSKQNPLSEPNLASADTTPGSACKRSAESTMVNVPETSKAQLSPQSVAESPDSRPGTMSDSSVGQSSVRKVYAVMSAASCQIQISEDANKTTAHETEQVTDDGKHPSGSDESGLCTPPRKRKMADCSHDAYNGVFPVENILRWRNNKGRNEVRVKWMPCTLCGAKFQNTWEPAESFPGYLDDKNEEPKKN
ncbi:uncharacterized protein zgc:66472 [Ctenopharyngodon idella]|uniref:uncharacterized protein zgc:66472 n=1 Tax=Ctenopharyngodon idella TaxID=7959 RepID=UPI0022320A5E|nr:uncharacterized protein zgc:66472 [Ctenopharyngodon idella]XP_051758545.1 uncharacterized protein zgc:66472 [Ctenopharyngodon idella]